MWTGRGRIDFRDRFVMVRFAAFLDDKWARKRAALGLIGTEM